MTDRLRDQIAAIWARALGVKRVNPDGRYWKLWQLWRTVSRAAFVAMIVLIVLYRLWD